MKKRKIFIFCLIIIAILFTIILAKVIYNNKKEKDEQEIYASIKNSVQEDIERYLKITAPYCIPSRITFSMTEYALIYQYGMDKEKLLDIDKKLYCKLRIEVRCVTENKNEWDTFLCCKNYIDEGYYFE